MASAADKKRYRDIKKMDEELKKTKDDLEASVRESIRRSEVMTVFKIGYNVGARALKRLFMKRYRYMKNLSATMISGRPVCPPDLIIFYVTLNTPEGRTRFHVVQIVHPDHGDGVQLLFKECNFYFVAFRPVNKKGEGHIWFRFNDENLPSHMQSCEIAYSSSYINLSNVTIGHGGLKSIYDALTRFTEENAHVKTEARKQALRCAAFMLSEAQRFAKVQNGVLNSILQENAIGIAHLDRLIHSWGNISREDYAKVVVECQRIVREVQEQNRKKNKKDAISMKQPIYQGYLLMSHKLYVYLFDDLETPNSLAKKSNNSYG